MELNATPASLIRILAAIMYDLIILILGLFMLVGFIVLPIYNGVTGNEAISAGQWFLPITLLTTAFLYYTLSWKIGRQTIGMKSWRLFVVASDDPKRALNWSDVTLRFIFSILSTLFVFSGFFMILLHPQKKSAHDILSKTHLVYIPK